ncbi:MAG: alkaline phosphatase family protein [Puniceicoccales bacterium]|jgi:predicted AlkP superfamily pyrophosphatase or phosphodiesterase|nr:alkaline phosphatase family protein [Puniceicoccales bacterium]
MIPKLISNALRGAFFLTLGMIAGVANADEKSSKSQSEGGAFNGRRVLILGLDGLRRDSLELALKNGDVPNMAKIAANGTRYWGMEAGGDLKGPTKQPTVSGPGWSTIVTGVFANKHGVTDNSFKNAHYDKYPHFFKYAREANPKTYLVSVCTWHPVNTKILLGTGDNLADICHCSRPAQKGEDPDIDTRDKTVEALTKQNPDAVFVHFNNPDTTGHAYGYGPHIPEYMECLKTLDKHIGDMLTAVEKRPNYAKESWLIVLTTDHGGKGKGHGGQSPEERDIVTIFSGEGFAKGKKDKTVILQDVVTPSVLKHLGIAIKPEWDLDSAPLN